MQQHPVVTYLRYVGFVVGIICFIFMLVRSGQNAQNPVYVRGKRSIQLVAVTAQNSFSQMDATVSATPAEKAAVSQPANAPQTTPVNQVQNNDASKVQQSNKHVEKANQADDASAQNVKAPGRLKHQD